MTTKSSKMTTFWVSASCQSWRRCRNRSPIRCQVWERRIACWGMSHHADFGQDCDGILFFLDRVSRAIGSEVISKFDYDSRLMSIGTRPTRRVHCCLLLMVLKLLVRSIYLLPNLICCAIRHFTRFCPIRLNIYHATPCRTCLGMNENQFYYRTWIA